ncbi:MAG: AIM24 family protein, partial [Opitutales bacterium]
KKELRGEMLRVDTGCIVGFTSEISYDIQMTGGLKSMFFGGEGMFLATLSGNGSVWLQSLPFSRLADRVIRYAPSSGGKEKGEGSVLGGIGRKLRGDND